MVFALDPFAPRDILVINCTHGEIRIDRVECDSLIYFYDYILGDSYDRYAMPDTLDAYGQIKPDMWRDFIPYDLIIVDGGLGTDPLSDNLFLYTESSFENYINSGGKLAYFGSYNGYRGEGMSEAPGFYPVTGYPFINEYFGIDSVFHIGLAYYPFPDSPPDTLAALIGAIPLLGEIPYIAYAPIINALGALSLVWPEGTAPSPSAFTLKEDGQPLYLAETMYPSTSLIDNQPVGVKTEVAGTATYLFGFHLWYMDPDSAMVLIDYLLNDGVSPEFICGDANGDEIVDVGDAVFLINHIFFEGLPPEPPEAGDVNNDGIVNVGDIVYIVNYIFREGPPPQCG
jgi:hypothetical protein